MYFILKRCEKTLFAKGRLWGRYEGKWRREIEIELILAKYPRIVALAYLVDEVSKVSQNPK